MCDDSNLVIWRSRALAVWTTVEYSIYVSGLFAGYFFVLCSILAMVWVLPMQNLMEILILPSNMTWIQDLIEI